jgi:hypothetical protein
VQEREKNVLMIIIPLQVIENIASAVIGETGPAGRDWLAWNQIFLLAAGARYLVKSRRSRHRGHLGSDGDADHEHGSDAELGVARVLAGRGS